MAALDMLGNVWAWGNTEFNLFDQEDLDNPKLIYEGKNI